MAWIRRMLVRLAILIGVPLPVPERSPSARHLVDELARVRSPIGTPLESLSRRVAREAMARTVEDGFDLEAFIARLLVAYDHALRDRNALQHLTVTDPPEDLAEVDPTR